MSTADLVAWLTLALVLIDTMMWILTLRAVGGLSRVVGPLIQRGMSLLGTVPPGVLGLVRPPSAPQAASAPAEIRMTKRGVRYVIDPVSGMARFLRKGASVPTGGAPPGAQPTVGESVHVGDGVPTEPDLNALAREYGYEPSTVAGMVAQYGHFLGGGGQAGAAPPTDAPLSLPTRSVGTAGGDPTDQLVSAGISAVLSGEATLSEVAKTVGPAVLPSIIKELRKSAAGQGSSVPAGDDGW